MSILFLNFFVFFFLIFCTLLLYASVSKILLFFKTFFCFLSFILCTLLLYASVSKILLFFKIFFVFCFLIFYPLYTSIIYYKFKNDTYFLKIFLCKLSCNLYNGLFTRITAIKNFWNYPHYVIFVTLHKQGLSFIIPFNVVIASIPCINYYYIIQYIEGYYVVYNTILYSGIYYLM